MRHLLTCTALALIYATAARADVILPPVFSEHMVLQRDQAVPIWGSATPGEQVTVRFRAQTKTTTADANGKWMVRLDKLAAGGPDTLIVAGRNTVEIGDVLVGEVWVGSGQSNMWLDVRSYTKADGWLAAAMSAAPYPRIRILETKGGRWQIAAGDALSRFSALLFSFGLPLHQELNVPVGLMHGSVSGSSSSHWIRAEAVKDDAECQAQIRKFAAKFDRAAATKKLESDLAQWQAAAALAKQQKKPVPPQPIRPPLPGEAYGAPGGWPGLHFDNFMRPIIPYGIRGVLWDQGESGTGLIGVADQAIVMDALVRDWRSEWGQGDFPFIYVQKPTGGGCAWNPDSVVSKGSDRFAALPAKVPNDGFGGIQFLRMLKIPNAGMAISTDLEAGQHPSNKTGYGRRAADVALGLAYGRKGEYCGPVYRSHSIEGAKGRVSFDHVGKGLAFKHGTKLQGFALAGKDGPWHWADAQIEEASVVLSSPNVAAPAALRYAWSVNHAWANLFNLDGYPALPFRTEP